MCSAAEALGRRRDARRAVKTGGLARPHDRGVAVRHDDQARARFGNLRHLLLCHDGSGACQAFLAQRVALALPIMRAASAGKSGQRCRHSPTIVS